MIKDLVKLANRLDAKGLGKEADGLDGIITKMAGDSPYEPLAREALKSIFKEIGGRGSWTATIDAIINGLDSRGFLIIESAPPVPPIAQPPTPKG